MTWKITFALQILKGRSVKRLDHSRVVSTGDHVISCTSQPQATALAKGRSDLSISINGSCLLLSI